ncbi:MAG: hypothetical protein HKN16_04970 [Saprospiraceae bacterium]|nr:hypothetical protein [Saprospiraceae bacterium]
MTKSRKCLECGIKISGRIDKKFCGDDCRNVYHNKQNKDSTNLMRNINNTLRKNHRILKKLNPTGKTKVNLTTLSRAGFNLHYFTNQYRTKAGKVYHFCYDQGYLQLDDETFALVKRMDFVDPY